MSNNQNGVVLGGVNLLLNRWDLGYQKFLRLYNIVSLWNVEWITHLQSFPEASDAQIEYLIQTKGA
jgi:hypothetical protein